RMHTDLVPLCTSVRSVPLWRRQTSSPRLTERPILVEDVEDRVLGLVADPDFVVEVGGRRLAGVADEAEDVSAADPLPGPDVEAGEVGVAGHEAVAVVDLDRVAVAAARTAEDHDPVGGRLDLGADRSRDVDPGVEVLEAGEGIEAVAEV